MSIGEKLKELRIANEMTLDYAGSIAGVSKQTLYKYENEKITNIPSDKIENLAALYGVSPAYIMGWSQNYTESINKTVRAMERMNADGQRIVANHAEKLDASGRYAITERADVVPISAIARAAAGAGAYNGEYDEPTAHMIASDSIMPHDAAIDVVGDSMEPTIMDGDVAFVVHSFDRIDGQIYAVNLDDETVIKRCFFQPDSLTLVSDNPHVLDRVITGADLETTRVVGLVVGRTTPVK